MEAHDRSSAARYRLVAAAHHFLLHGIPLRVPNTSRALEALADVFAATEAPLGDQDAVLLRLLIVIERECGCRVPGLVTRYLESRGTEPIQRFRSLVESLLRYRGISDSHVRNAVSVIDAKYADSTLRQEDVARAVGVSPSQLSVSFRRETGLTFTEYLRDCRLSHAATLLADSNRVKEVWVAVGYNHASNFVHDFKKQFGVTPTTYKRDAARYNVEPVRPVTLPKGKPLGKRLLIVDDDDVTRSVLSMHFAGEGFEVQSAATGDQALTIARTYEASAVLLDYHLPDMDGVACLKEMRQTVRSKVGVAIFTADWSIDTRRAEIAALGAIVISKLCDLDALSAAIAGLCVGSTQYPLLF